MACGGGAACRHRDSHSDGMDALSGRGLRGRPCAQPVRPRPRMADSGGRNSGRRGLSRPHARLHRMAAQVGREEGQGMPHGDGRPPREARHSHERDPSWRHGPRAHRRRQLASRGPRKPVGHRERHGGLRRRLRQHRAHRERAPGAREMTD